MDHLSLAASKQGQVPLGRGVRSLLLEGSVSPAAALHAMGLRAEIAGYSSEKRSFSARPADASCPSAEQAALR